MCDDETRKHFQYLISKLYTYTTFKLSNKSIYNKTKPHQHITNDLNVQKGKTEIAWNKKKKYLKMWSKWFRLIVNKVCLFVWTKLYIFPLKNIIWFDIWKTVVWLHCSFNTWCISFHRINWFSVTKCVLSWHKLWIDQLNPIIIESNGMNVCFTICSIKGISVVVVVYSLFIYFFSFISFAYSDSFSVAFPRK